MAARKRRAFSRTMAVSRMTERPLVALLRGLAHDLEVEARLRVRVEELLLG